MREILFRGKRKDNSEWVEGYYACIGETPVIFTGELDFSKWDIRAKMNVIIPETVGQFTGLTDRNGKRIFEGDIVERGDRIWVIEYDVMCAQFVMKIYTKNSVFWNRSFDFVPSEWCEVIGNIFDNPELLENNTGKEKSI